MNLEVFELSVIKSCWDKKWKIVCSRVVHRSTAIQQLLDYVLLGMSIPSQGSLDYKLCRNLFLTHSFTTAGPRQEQDFQDLYLNLILYFKSTQSEKAKQVLKSSKEQGLSKILQNL